MIVTDSIFRRLKEEFIFFCSWDLFSYKYAVAYLWLRLSMLYCIYVGLKLDIRNDNGDIIINNSTLKTYNYSYNTFDLRNAVAHFDSWNDIADCIRKVISDDGVKAIMKEIGISSYNRICELTLQNIDMWR